MKLITIKNVIRGELYPTGVFLSFGKKVEGDWYIRIELPFTFIDKNYYHLMTNTYKPTKCRKVYCLIHRNKYNFTKLYSANKPIFNINDERIKWQ